MRNFSVFPFFMLCFFQLDMGKCINEVPILRYYPVKNCPDNQCIRVAHCAKSLNFNLYSNFSHFLCHKGLTKQKKLKYF